MIVPCAEGERGTGRSKEDWVIVPAAGTAAGALLRIPPARKTVM